MIYELQVGFHSNRTIPYQRIICDKDFKNYYYEVNDNGKVKYSKEQPSHWIPEVEEACQNIDLILKVAEMNFKAGKMIATIRDNNIITEDIDIWGDIKVWRNGEYPKNHNPKLEYVKKSIHNKYLKSGINKVSMITDELYYEGDVLHFEIESSTFQFNYTVNIMGYDRLTSELTNNIHGYYHGYAYFKTFEEVQEWFMENYNVKLVKRGETLYSNY